jgi:hypothetical protein
MDRCCARERGNAPDGCMNPCNHDGVCRRTSGGPWSSPPPSSVPRTPRIRRAYRDWAPRRCAPAYRFDVTSDTRVGDQGRASARLGRIEAATLQVHDNRAEFCALPPSPLVNNSDPGCGSIDLEPDVLLETPPRNNDAQDGGRYHGVTWAFRSATSRHSCLARCSSARRSSAICSRRSNHWSSPLSHIACSPVRSCAR